MKIINKSIKVLPLFMGLMIALVACNKDDTDVFAIEDGIAQKTMLGTYVNLVVDSANLTTTIDEWTFGNDFSGVYKHVSTGQGTNENVQKKFSWSQNTMSEDNLKMLVTAVFENGDKVDLVWQDGLINLPSDQYTTIKNPISLADVLLTLNTDFKGDFIAEQVAYYQEKRKVPYLAWSTEPLKQKGKPVYFDTKEEAEAKCKELGEALIESKDTILWFISEYPSALSFTDRIIFTDSVNNELVLKRVMLATPEDTAIITVADIPVVVEYINEETPDVIRYSLINLKSSQKTKEVMVDVAPNQLEIAEMIFNRDEQSNNTASYSYQRTTKTDEVFTKPTSEKAIETDSVYTITDAVWTPISYTNAKSFVVMITGTEQIIVRETNAGEVIREEVSTPQQVSLKLAMSGFTTDKVDSKGKEVKVNVECGGLKYKLQ